MSDEKRSSQSFVEDENTSSSVDQNGIPILTDVTPEESRRVLWKIDLCLIPILAVCYMFQFLDKMTLNYATILGLQEDLNLVGNQFSWTASIFYFGYFVASYAAAYMSVKLPIGKYLACTVYASLSYQERLNELTVLDFSGQLHSCSMLPAATSVTLWRFDFSSA